MKLTPNLEDFSSKIFEKKTTFLETGKDINNRIVYLLCTKEDLIKDITSLSSPHLVILEELIKSIEKKESSLEQNAYEIKDLNAFRKELTKIRAL